jgi:DNA modification methylase
MKLINADCIQAMKEMPDNSVDSIVTDPPYELGFMGKSWDATGIAFNVQVWQEALRVLKPGGHLIAFSGSRTYHRMAVAIEDAGFEIRDQIMWVYGSGFPKSHDIAKGIDKSDAGIARRERDLKFTEWMRSTGLKARQIDEVTVSNMGGHYLTDKEQPTVATAEMFDKLRPYLPEVPEWVEEMIRQRTIESENFKKREVIGTKSSSLGGTVAAGERNQEIIDYHKNKIVDITAPATAAAKQWQGWGTALKPAHEPMVLARKPLIGTVANNVLTYGTGGLNIDGTRVEGDAWTRPPQSDNAIYGKFEPTQTQSNPEGRFPANFIHDGSDEVVALFPGTKSGTLNRANITAENNTYGARPKELTGEYEANSGSAARFFYCAKASKRDRNEGLDGFEAKQVFGDEGGTYQGLSNSKLPSANHHPTVKPTSLMQYLVRLVTPPNGIVLDPFMGSGSTGKACAYENFDFIGIDQSAEYVEIARARIFFAIATNDEKLPL